MGHRMLDGLDWLLEVKIRLTDWPETIRYTIDVSQLVSGFFGPSFDQSESSVRCIKCQYSVCVCVCSSHPVLFVAAVT